MAVTVIIAVTPLICGVITAVTSTADAVMTGKTFSEGFPEGLLLLHFLPRLLQLLVIQVS